jgi:hypothetical protein
MSPELIAQIITSKENDYIEKQMLLNKRYLSLSLLSNTFSRDEQDGMRRARECYWLFLFYLRGK